MDLNSFGEIFCLQNDWLLFPIQLSCSKANLEFNFFHLFQNIDEGIVYEMNEVVFFRTVGIPQADQPTPRTISEPFGSMQIPCLCS